jgi:quercetin dioxygenase-like cupin family protein
MAENKQPAVLKVRRLKADVMQFSVQEEMLQLVQRVAGNKSKRTAKTLVKEGPLRVLVVALDAGGKLEEHAVDGPFSVQCLMGRVTAHVAGTDRELRAGDLLVVDTGVTHDIEAKESAALLITITRAGAD